MTATKYNCYKSLLSFMAIFLNFFSWRIEGIDLGWLVLGYHIFGILLRVLLMFFRRSEYLSEQQFRRTRRSVVLFRYISFVHSRTFFILTFNKFPEDTRYCREWLSTVIRLTKLTADLISDHLMIDGIILLTTKFERYNNITCKTYNLCNLHNCINYRLSDYYQPIYKLQSTASEMIHIFCMYILHENKHGV